MDGGRASTGDRSIRRGAAGARRLRRGLDRSGASSRAAAFGIFDRAFNEWTGNARAEDRCSRYHPIATGLRAAAPIDRHGARTMNAARILIALVLALCASHAAAVRPAAAPGTNHSLVVLDDGSLYAIGSNSNGQVGNNSSVGVSNWTFIMSNVRAVAAGSLHSLALMKDGTVKAWGWNLYGQLGNGTTDDKRVPVAVLDLTDIVAIAAGQSFSLALRRDGTVWAWGQDNFGQLGDNNVLNARVFPVQVKATANTFLTGVVGIAAGEAHALALFGDGSVVAWGYGAYGQLGNGAFANSSLPVPVSGIANAAQIAAGRGHSVALLRDGTVKTWGLNSAGQLGNNSTTNSNVPVQVELSIFGPTAGLKLLPPPHTLILDGIAQVQASLGATFALTNAGYVLSWGSSGSGENGSTSGRLLPGLVANITRASSIHSGANGASTFVYGAQVSFGYGQFAAFGFNLNYELGVGDNVNHSTPLEILLVFSGPKTTQRTSFGIGHAHEDALWRRVDGASAAWDYTGETVGAFTPRGVPGVETSWQAIGTGDVDGDGNSDLFWYDAASGAVAVWAMDGSAGLIAAHFPGGAGGTWQPVAIGDLDGDGAADILWRDTASGVTVVWYLARDFSLDAALSFGTVPREWAIAGIGDVDGDGVRDVVWFRADDGQVAIWRMSATGYHAWFPAAVGSGSAWRIAMIGDLDGDWREDLFWRNQATGDTAAWYLNGGLVSAAQFFVGVPIADWSLQSIGHYAQLPFADQVLWYGSGGNVVRWNMKGRGVAPTVEFGPGIGPGWSIVR
jgi:alpha-tubulin suppressor-like RCC1 family protein